MSLPVYEATTQDAQTMGLHFRCLLLPDRSAPLIVLVHGRAGTVSVMWSFRRALPEHCSVVSVEAPLADPIGGKSWWLIDAEHAATGAPRAAQQIIDFVARFEQHFDLTPRSRSAIGFSQGAGTLSVVAQNFPTVFSRIGLLAGFVVEQAPPPPTDRIPEIFIAHGSEDTVVTFSRAEAGRDFLQHQGFPVQFHTDPVGHKVGTNGVKALKQWLTAL